MATTLGDALPREMARVRDEIMPLYLEIGPSGRFALEIMRVQLDRAASAMISGDVEEMLDCFQKLKEFAA